MNKYAVIVNGIVQNVIIADTLQDAEECTGHTCVEFDNSNPAVVGLGYDGTTFEQPTIELPTV